MRRWRLPQALVILAAIAAGCAAHHELEPASTRAPAPAKTLLAHRCGGCHAVPDPASMAGEKWLASLERMKRRIELPAAEWDTLAAMARDTTASR